jgi:stage V sporulation protein AD
LLQNINAPGKSVSGQKIINDYEDKYGKKTAITGVTAGKIEDFGIKDSFNMGCAMAPAAAWTIRTNLKDFSRTPDDYDAIITGDLGSVGQQALFELLSQDNIDISGRHYDCGMLIYDADNQDVHAGGSGCGCSAVVLSAYILPKLAKGEWKRVLFVPTGALLNKTSFNEGQNVPGIAHGIVVESI